MEGTNAYIVGESESGSSDRAETVQFAKRKKTDIRKDINSMERQGKRTKAYIGKGRMVVYCRVRMEGYHAWSGATGDVGFLANRHRHIFHIEMGVEVGDDDREVEFIGLGRRLNSFLFRIYPVGSDVGSCEQIARTIAEEFGAKYVDVSEDGENGAKYERKGLEHRK